MTKHLIYRFETDSRRGCFSNGRARVRRHYDANDPYGYTVHNPGAYDDYLVAEPNMKLHSLKNKRNTEAHHFGFFDLTQARHWFGTVEIVHGMYADETGNPWATAPTPLRQYEVHERFLNRAFHQVTFDSRKATLLRTFTEAEAIALLTEDVPDGAACSLCPVRH